MNTCVHWRPLLAAIERNCHGRGLPGAFVGNVIINANIHTMETPEARASAMAWHEDTLVFVGSDDDARALAKAKGWPVQDLEGRVVLPGFVDAHTHFLHVGIKKTRPDLRGCQTKTEALGRLQSWLEEHLDGPLTTGGVIAEGWDEGEWHQATGSDKEPIRQGDLDALLAAVGAPDLPLVARRICGHIAVASSAALPPIWEHWPDPKLVDQDTGVLLEQPSLYLNEVMPASPEVCAQAIEYACATAHQLGITSLGDYEQAPMRQALLDAAAAGTLTVRVACSIYTQQLENALAEGFQTGRKAPGPDGPSDWLQDGGLKVFHDGSLGGHSALLREPYLDKDTRGLANWTDEEVLDWYTKANAANVQIHAHVIGDGAVDQGLHAFQQLSNGNEDDFVALRHRFEHYEIVHDEQIKQTAELGVVASSQPNFVGEWSAKGGMYEERLGARYLLNNRFQQFKAHGVRLAFGSDGMPLGPLYGLHCAIHHPVPSERLQPEEAVWHYTREAAWSIHMDHVGWLAAGNKADFLVLEQSELDEQPKKWILRQVVAGGQERCQNDQPTPYEP